MELGRNKIERSEAKPVWDKQNILDSNKTERDPLQAPSGIARGV